MPNTCVPRARVALATSIAVLLAAGCSHSSTHAASSATQPTAAPAASPTTTAPATGLLGVYLTDFSGTEQLAGHAVQVMAGREQSATLTITSTEVRVATQNGTNYFDLGPSFSYTADHLTIAADPNCDNRTGPPSEGTYTYTLQGATLTFQAIADTCIDRAGVLTSHPWHRAG